MNKEISVREFDNTIQITTPFLDHTNDYIQIYAQTDDAGNISLSDDGYFINNLAMSGVEISRSPARKERLRKILAAYGLQLDGDEIKSSANITNFAQRKHLFIQGLLKVDDLFTTSKSNVLNMFNEDVKAFFDDNNIFYSENLSIIGRTGSIYSFDFHFQRTKNKPERFCKTINHLTETTRNSAIFSWTDSAKARPDNSQMIVMLNDENRVKPADLKAFDEYNIQHVLFNQAQNNLDLFCA